jgi:hypothetical protein
LSKYAPIFNSLKNGIFIPGSFSSKRTQILTGAGSASNCVQQRPAAVAALTMRLDPMKPLPLPTLLARILFTGATISIIRLPITFIFVAKLRLRTAQRV